MRWDGGRGAQSAGVRQHGGLVVLGRRGVQHAQGGAQALGVGQVLGVRHGGLQEVGRGTPGAVQTRRVVDASAGGVAHHAVAVVSRRGRGTGVQEGQLLAVAGGQLGGRVAGRCHVMEGRCVVQAAPCCILLLCPAEDVPDGKRGAGGTGVPGVTRVHGAG